MLDAAELGKTVDKAVYADSVPTLREGLLDAQYDLSRSADFATIILMSGVSAAGKGETINQLVAWMDPRFITTHASDQPTDEERLRPPMWRYWRRLPAKGRIAIFFDHWYSDLTERRAHGKASDSEVAQRIAEISRFERMLTEEGVLLLKFNLHLSHDQQRKRLAALAADPATRWRVTDEDLAALDHYDAIRQAFEHIIGLTNQGHAPWVVVEAADHRYRNLAVGHAVLTALRGRLDQPGKGAVPGIAAVLPAGGEARALGGPSVLSELAPPEPLGEPTYARQLEEWQGRLALLTRHKRFRRHALIVAFEGNDAAGKGGAIKRVAAALDTRYRQIVPIAKPTDEAAARPYLWRFWKEIPRRGHTTIFDRTWYGRVLVERVEGLCSEADWRRAYGEINDFEAELSDDGVILVKFWLAISRDEQLRRFKEREATGFKRYKITEEDWRNREKWDDYEAAVSEMVARTSSHAAPWTLIEAEDKRRARIAVMKTICRRLEALL